MTFDLTRRHALGLIGAPVALGAFPRLAAATAAAAAPWLGTPQQLAAEKMLLRLIADPEVKAAQAKIRAELATWPRTKTLPDAAATLDGAILQWTNSLIFAELGKDTAHPAFLWGVDDTPRDWLGHHLPGVGMSGDNPDNIYRGARVDGAGRYEILGQFHPDSRPTQTLFELGLVDIAKPTTMMTPTARGRSPDPQPSAQVNQDQLVVDAQGRFRITVGAAPDPSWAGPNHMVLPGQGYCSISVRDVLADWTLRAPALTIRRLDKVEATAPWGFEDYRKLVLEDLPGFIDFWAKFPDIWFGGIKPNQHSPAQGRPGGWGFVAGINFHLAKDEAIVVTLDPGGSKYTGFQINDPWMIAPDARKAQVCLNKAQTTPNADGTVTYVIAAKDPGAANWLDTTGYHDGIAILRWQAIPPDLKGDNLFRDFKLVKWAELETMKDLPRVTPAERRKRVAARKGDYETRVR